MRRTRIRTAWVIGGVLTFCAWCVAAFAEQTLPTAGVREVAASARGVIPLTTKIRYTTMILLPDDEEIVDVLCGDRDFWVISAAHNIAHVKPAKEGAATNLNLVTTSGTVYSFLLAESKGTTDLKVYVTPDPDAAPKQAKYYSAGQVNELRAALADARDAIRTAHASSQEEIAGFKKAYPANLSFSYTSPPYAKPFFVRSIWHDDKATYIKADTRELPALYEVTDGGASILNYHVENGTYVVPKVLDRGYLAIGKQRFEFASKER